MRLRSWRGTTPLSTSTKRPFPWARIALLLAIVAIAAYLIIPNLNSVRADALVQGDLVPVAPIYTVRIDKLLVGCNDKVTAGQKVAMVSNFLVQADYQRQFLQSEQQRQLSEIALDQNVAAAQQNASTMREKALEAQINAQKLAGDFRSYDAAYRQGAIAKVEWDARRLEWQSAEAEARSAQSAYQRAEQEVGRITQAQNARIASSAQISNQAQSLAQRVGSEPLLAPVSGYIVECIDRPQNVIEASKPIFSIFEPNRTYVLAYFDPNSIEKIRLDEPVDVTISGLSHNVTGRVGSIYPNLTKLPPQLTRFFWQHVQFSEYRPVKILLDKLSPEDRARLYYGAQARVSVSLRDNDDSRTAAKSAQ